MSLARKPNGGVDRATALPSSLAGSRLMRKSLPVAPVQRFVGLRDANGRVVCEFDLLLCELRAMDKSTDSRGLANQGGRLRIRALSHGSLVTHSNRPSDTSNRLLSHEPEPHLRRTHRSRSIERRVLLDADKP